MAGAGIGAPSIGCSGGEEERGSFLSRERGKASLAGVWRDGLSLERQAGDLMGAGSSGRSVGQSQRTSSNWHGWSLLGEVGREQVMNQSVCATAQKFRWILSAVGATKEL